jgi:hypothetical protein
MLRKPNRCQGDCCAHLIASEHLLPNTISATQKEYALVYLVYIILGSWGGLNAAKHRPQ